MIVFWIVIISFMTLASAKDLTIGIDGGKFQLEENRIASPTIWRRVNTYTYNVSDTDVISKVEIIDQREDKLAGVKILEGGVGHRNLAIELKSPSIFRGYNFIIRVFAMPVDEAKSLGIIKDGNKQDLKQLLEDAVTGGSSRESRSDEMENRMGYLESGETKSQAVARLTKTAEEVSDIVMPKMLCHQFIQ